MPPDVHDIPVGKIGFVVHSDSGFVLNAWIRYWDPEEERRAGHYLEIPIFNGHILKLAYHIPHGTPVLVTAAAKVMARQMNGDPIVLYRVLWGEMDCWVDRKKLINPYLHDEYRKDIIDNDGQDPDGSPTT